MHAHTAVDLVGMKQGIRARGGNLRGGELGGLGHGVEHSGFNPKGDGPCGDESRRPRLVCNRKRSDECPHPFCVNHIFASPSSRISSSASKAAYSPSKFVKYIAVPVIAWTISFCVTPHDFANKAA